MAANSTSMRGKICMVTGANAGLGKATALGLTKLGATVVVVCRDRARGEAARADSQTASGNAAVARLIADLAAQSSMRQLAKDFRARYPGLDVLVNLDAA